MTKSLPNEGWCEVEFPVLWEEKEITCVALGLEGFAQHVRHRQGESVEFWTILSPVIGESLHTSASYLSAEKANKPQCSDVAQAMR